MKAPSVFVLDRHRQPLMPCHPARARKLMKRGRAAVFRHMPFTIIMKDVEAKLTSTQPLRIKLDPGSKTTGIAITRMDDEGIEHVVSLMELVHRGLAIKKAMEKRKNYRRRRRSANLRYRAKRFDNRSRPEGWLPPSLYHRVQTTMTWVRRACRLAPIQEIVVEGVSFDTQQLQNPEIEGIEYQQGTLFGTNLREYLLEKFEHRCVYCGAENVPLNIDHVEPKSKGGSDRVSNLVLACVACNQKKGARSLEEFLAGKPALMSKIREQLKTSLRDAAAVNATRNRLIEALRATGLPVQVSTGAQTKFNRRVFGIEKSHVADAASTGRIQGVVGLDKVRVLQIYCRGRGSHCRTRTNASGFPVAYFTRTKRPHGIATGDLVQARSVIGKNKGRVWLGRVETTRESGSVQLRVRGRDKPVNVQAKNCQVKQMADGYSYQYM